MLMKDRNIKYIEIIWISGIGLLSSILWALLGFLGYVLYTSNLLTDQEKVVEFLENRSVTNTFLGFGLLFMLCITATTILIKKIKKIEL